MKTKKALTCLITVVVLLAMLSTASLTVSATQPGAATFSVGDLTASAGGTFVAELTLKGTDISGFQGVLLYDRDAFTLEKIEKSSTLKGITAFDIENNLYKSGSFMYAHAQGANMDGAVLTFTFKVASGAKNGAYPFALVNTRALNSKPADLKTSVASAGSVTVSNGAGQVGTPGQVPNNPNLPVLTSEQPIPNTSELPNFPSPNNNPNTDPNNPPNPSDPDASAISGASGNGSPSSIILVPPVPIDSDDSADVSSSSTLFGGGVLLYILIGLGALVIAGVVVVIVVTRKKNRRMR